MLSSAIVVKESAVRRFMMLILLETTRKASGERNTGANCPTNEVLARRGQNAAFKIAVLRHAPQAALLLSYQLGFAFQWGHVGGLWPRLCVRQASWQRIEGESPPWEGLANRPMPDGRKATVTLSSRY